MAAKASKELIVLAPGTTCWLCGIKATRLCQTCTAAHCSEGCPCECREAVSAAMRYWLDESSTAHVMVDVGQPDLAVCGKVNQVDWRGKHVGSFHRAVPTGKARCQRCFAPQLPASEGWGAESADLYLPDEQAQRRVRAVRGADGIRRWKFTQDTSQVAEIQFRTSTYPTPIRVLAEDADAMMPWVTARLARTEQGARNASERMLECIRRAETLRGEARQAALAEANIALDDLRAIYLAQEGERAAHRAYYKAGYDHAAARPGAFQHAS